MSWKNISYNKTTKKMIKHPPFFSAIFAIFQRKKWRFSQKPML
jgi:hypothetical protein